MAKVQERASVHLEVPIVLTESEARALEALAGYGTDHFLNVFYTQLGRYYLEPHEGGLRSLFETTKVPIRQALHRIDQARKVFENGQKPGT